MSDPQPNAETITDKSATDQQQRKPSPDPKPVDDQQSQQQQNQTNRDAARNGDAESNKGSDSPAHAQAHAQAQSEQLQSPTHSGSARKSVRWSPELVTESRDFNNNDGNSNSGRNNIYLDGSNPYVSKSPAQPSSPSFSIKETMGTVKDVLGRWGKRVGEATRKAEDLSRNTWQHLKTSPSFADAALGRIAQGTKVLAEGGYEKIFRQTFETVPEEQLLDSFACYLSTSAGPVMGVLYVSTAKLAFCSDNPLSYKSNGQTEWSYYKVVIPLHQLKAVNPSSSRANPAEKYIQVISVDNHEFWYMGFLNYNGAVQFLQDALLARESQTV